MTRFIPNSKKTTPRSLQALVQFLTELRVSLSIGTLVWGSPSSAWFLVFDKLQ